MTTRNVRLGSQRPIDRMKLIAIFQILILLTSVIIPEGAHRIVRGCSCGDDCQCSSETKTAGTCCCGTKPSETASANKSSCCQSKDETSRSACCSKPPKTDSPSCCQKPDSPKSCCEAPTSSEAIKTACCDPQTGGRQICGRKNSQGSNSRHSHDSISSPSCGCTEVIIHLTVVLMPRLRPASTFLDDPLIVVDSLPLVSDSTLANCLLPEVPPPKNRLSATKTNSFAA